MNQPRTISDMWVGLLERNLDGMDECIMECVKTNGTTNPLQDKERVETSNLASNGANSSGSSFSNVETSSTSTTPIVDKIGKLEKLIIDGKVTFVDDDSKPLKKERVGFSTTSLVEQLRDTYENGDYDEDPYDDDIY
ncbi:hypothetical protein Tco_1120479, partial [Tanacetum coccineum]